MSPTSSSDPSDGGPVITTDRATELSHNLAAVRHRLDQACLAAGRPVGDVTLIAVTKFFPAADAAAMARAMSEAGIAAELGESRDQEAAAKVGDLAELTDVAVRWHFIGRLQTNKAKSVARYADLVHSVDRADLADALAGGAEKAGRTPLPVLVQLSLDADPSRGGSAADDLLRLADRVAEQSQLRLDGIMAIAPQDSDPDAQFARLAEIAQRLTAQHPTATIVSAGMTGDLEQAVAHGATHVRIGTALLGPRNPNIS